MDLPTYTNIWRIEKRLYKLYDFNLPMPLPIVQVGVFLCIFVFWIMLLQIARVPFQPPWHVVYLVPPGVVTYFVTRPVLEGKRLPELLLSQLRYLVEPRTWCRLAPAYEPERATVRGSVWHRVAGSSVASPTAPALHARRRSLRPDVGHPDRLERVPAGFPSGGTTAPVSPPPGRETARVVPGPVRADLPVATTRPGNGAGASLPETPPRAPAAPPAAAPAPYPRPGEPREPAEPAHPRTGPRWRRLAYAITRGPLDQGQFEGNAPADLDARAGAPFEGNRRVAVLGAAPGAGQTTAALLLGHSLARHRADRAVAVDASPGSGSLAGRSRTESPETLTSLLDAADRITGYLGLRAYTSQAGSGLEVIASDEDAALLTSLGRGDFATLAEILDSYYKVSLFDPATALVPRVLPLVDQLVLVASAGAGSAVDTKLEWLRRHGYAALAAASVLVVNGGPGAADADSAVAGAAGRCREVVHLPWDGRLDATGGAKPRPKSATASPAELDGVHQATRDAALRLAATLVDGFSAAPDRLRQEVSS